MKRWIPLLLVGAAATTACLYDYDLPPTSSAGGQTGSASVTDSSSADKTTGASSTSASSTTSSTATTSSATSSSTGMTPDPLYLYKRPFPLVGGAWKKVSFTEEFGAGGDVPRDHIVAATHLQTAPVLLVLTDDNVLHVLHKPATAWTATPIDTFFPVPTSGCQRDDLAPCDGSQDTGACTKLSTLGISDMTHVPEVPSCGTGGPAGPNESILMLGPTVATQFKMSPSGAFSPIFEVQRDYRIDQCCPDPYPMNATFLWDVEIIDPAQCGLANDWYQNFEYMSDGKLRKNDASTLCGPNLGVFADQDPSNPLFDTPAPMDQPTPSAAVAGYFEQGAAAKTGMIVLIAP
ncbi:MAG: hypothetical protein U0414_24660 [Polyangiaceae bacterium]